MLDFIYDMTTIFLSVLLTIEGGFIFFMCGGLIVVLTGILLMQVPVANKAVNAVVKGSSYDPSEEKYSISIQFDVGGHSHNGSFFAPMPIPSDQHVIVFIDPKHPERISNYPVKRNAALICMITGSVVFVVAAMGLFTIPRMIQWRQEQKMRLQQQIRRHRMHEISMEREHRARIRSLNKRQLSRLLARGDEAYRRRVSDLLKKNNHDEWYVNDLVPHLLRQQESAKVASYWDDGNTTDTLRRASSLKRDDALLKQ